MNNTLAAIWMPGLDEIGRIGPLWALVATVVAILIGALFVGRNWRVAGGTALVGAIVTAWLAWRGLAAADASPWAGLAPDGASPMLVVDPFSHFFIFLLAVFLSLVIVLWFIGQDAGRPEDVARRPDSAEFFVLLVGSAFGMALMVSTTNLLMILLAVEMASLPSYALAGFRKKHRLGAEASLKYVLFGAVTSATMVYGVSLLYGQYLTLDLVEIGRQFAVRSQSIGTTVLMGASLVGLMVGVAFKVSAVPFHFWCPDVFEGAAVEVTTWLSVASKAAGLGLMLRIVASFVAGPDSQAALQAVTLTLGLMAAITCTVGNLSALRQTNLKRLLAYSSIAHAGYMLMAAAIVWHPTGDAAAHPAFSAVAAYLVVYLFMNLAAFGCVALVYWRTGSEHIDAFNGLGRRAPVLAVAMAACLFSLVGLPPLGGFIVKWYLLAALYDADLIWLVFVAVFNTLISLYYYARVAYAMFFIDDGRPALNAPPLGAALVAACSVVVLLTGTIWAGSLKRFSDSGATDLYTVAKAAEMNDAKADAAIRDLIRPEPNPFKLIPRDAAPPRLVHPDDSNDSTASNEE